MDNLIQPLPNDAQEFSAWSWAKIEPYYARLNDYALTAQNVDAWLADWSQLHDLIDESYWRLYVATSVNTADPESARRFECFMDSLHHHFLAAEHQLKEKILASGLEIDGFQVPLRNLCAEAAIFRQSNLTLLALEQKLEKEHDRIKGAQTCLWDGHEVPLDQLYAVFQEPNRARRKDAWRLQMTRRLQDRAALDDLWRRFLAVRLEMAANAGFANYRDYRWQQLQRFDYTPDDCKRFHRAIANISVPAAARLYEKRRVELGVASLRPWDLHGDQGLASVVSPPHQPPLKPFTTIAELESGCAEMFQRVHPELGAQFKAMRCEALLDLGNRCNKAPSSYCTHFEAAQQPFIFMNAIGLNEDVFTLLHEAGHAFHGYACNHLPYFQQRWVTDEFTELAAMGMEFLAAAYLSHADGGFYSDADAARALREKLDECIFLWPFVALVDSFQHWVYENMGAALEPANCDAAWARLWQTFMVGVDWSGLDAEMQKGWHRILHIFTVPFYYVEYGIAQLGAVDLLEQARADRAGAVAAYRRALALGGTVRIPDLYAAAGVRFALDADTLQHALNFMEQQIEELERV